MLSAPQHAAVWLTLRYFYFIQRFLWLLFAAQAVVGPATGWSLRALMLDLMLVCGMAPTRNMDPTKATQLVVDDTEADGKKLDAARRHIPNDPMT